MNEAYINARNLILNNLVDNFRDYCSYDSLEVKHDIDEDIFNVNLLMKSFHDHTRVGLDQVGEARDSIFSCASQQQIDNEMVYTNAVINVIKMMVKTSYNVTVKN